MADFYADMQQFARDILSPTSEGGLGQGRIQLTRTAPGAPDPAAPWEPVQPVTQTIAIKGAVRGIDTRLVGSELGGTVLLSSDRVAITEVPSITYEAGDTLSVDGRPVHVIAVENIPASGVTAAVKWTIRG